MKTSIKILGLLILSITALGCEKTHVPSGPLLKHRQAQMLMGTVVQVDVCYEKDNEQQLFDVYRKVWKKFADIDDAMNVYKGNSEISSLNRSYPQKYNARRAL